MTTKQEMIRNLLKREITERINKLNTLQQEYSDDAEDIQCQMFQVAQHYLKEVHRELNNPTTEIHAAYIDPYLEFIDTQYGDNEYAREELATNLGFLEGYHAAMEQNLIVTEIDYNGV